MGFEPTTFCLGSRHSTTELHPPAKHPSVARFADGDNLRAIVRAVRPKDGSFRCRRGYRQLSEVRDRVAARTQPLTPAEADSWQALIVAQRGRTVLSGTMNCRIPGNVRWLLRLRLGDWQIRLGSPRRSRLLVPRTIVGAGGSRRRSIPAYGWGQSWMGRQPETRIIAP